MGAHFELELREDTNWPNFEIQVYFPISSEFDFQFSDCFGSLNLDEKRSCISEQWSEWGICSNLCGLGVRNRHRKRTGFLTDEVEKEDCFGCLQPCS